MFPHEQQDKALVLKGSVASQDSGVNKPADSRVISGSSASDSPTLDSPTSGNSWAPDRAATASLLGLLSQANLPEALLNQVSQQLAQLEDHIQTQAQTIEQLRQESRTDSLTGLANRRAYDEKLQAEWTRAMRTGQPLALISLDVDHFKRYNDCYGHIQGDRCLQEVALVLREAVQRGGDLACRVGGEEFMIVLPGATAHTAKALAEKIRLGLAAKALRHEQNEAAPSVTLSIGVGHIVPHPAAHPDLLYQAVDRALYRAKQQGRNQISLAEPVELPEADRDTKTLGLPLPRPTSQGTSQGIINLRANQTAADRNRSAAAKARWHRLISHLATNSRFSPFNLRQGLGPGLGQNLRQGLGQN
ncbi:MAG: GGDEF domain-containing protein [Elainella sp.]